MGFWDWLSGRNKEHRTIDIRRVLAEGMKEEERCGAMAELIVGIEDKVRHKQMAGPACVPQTTGFHEFINREITLLRRSDADSEKVQRQLKELLGEQRKLLVQIGKVVVNHKREFDSQDLHLVMDWIRQLNDHINHLLMDTKAVRWAAGKLGAAA